MTEELNFRSISLEDIEKKMTMMHEDDFSRGILVPLFQEVYGGRVEFVGGRVEKGRDILIQKIDEIGDPHSIAVQVKKVKAGTNAGSNSFQTLITQLNQAASEKIIRHNDGFEENVNSFMVVTPYFIGQRVLDSHRGAYQNAVNGKDVKVLDGMRVIELIKRHRPSLLKRILGESLRIEEHLYSHLDNEDLMNAMGVSNIRLIKNFYCAIDVLIGNMRHTKYIRNNISSRSEVALEIKVKDIRSIQKTASEVKNSTGIDVFIEPGIDELPTDDSLIESYNSLRNKLSQNIDTLSQPLETDGESTKLAEKLAVYFNDQRMADIVYHTERHLKKHPHEATIVKTTITNILEAANTCQDIVSKMRRKKLTVTLNLESLCNVIENTKRTLRTTSCKNIDEVRSYLETSETLVKCLSLAAYFEDSITFNNSKYENLYRGNEVSLDQVFDAKKNISVLGDAGSGKTTSLKMYASRLIDRRENRLIVFSTLSNICSYALERNSQSLLLGIHQFYKNADIPMSIETIKNELSKGNATIILDSVDESIARHSWVIKSIVAFSKEYPDCQIVISSRFSIHEIGDIPFAHVSLLPFNESQKRDFFRKWFNDSDDAELLISHLEAHPQLNKIVVNPLSATILCVLRENNIPLPESETALYRERFNLLAGKFDSSKNIKRLESPSEKLIDIAKYLALRIHQSEQRGFTLNEILAIVFDYHKTKTDDEANEIINDLVRSEIIVHEGQNRYSFGHLRFQEYLASVELLTNREFNTEVLLRDSWWYDILVLYAKEARSIGWLIDYATLNGMVSETKELLLNLVEERPEKEQETLRRRIATAVVTESTNEDIYLDERSFDKLKHPLDV